MSYNGLDNHAISLELDRLKIEMAKKPKDSKEIERQHEIIAESALKLLANFLMNINDIAFCMVEENDRRRNNQG